MTDAAAPEAFPGHDAGIWAPAPFEIVASWPEGHFAENLAVHPDGRVFVSLHSESRIDCYDPATGALSAFASTPAPVAGLAFDASGALWATGGVLGATPGIVWTISQDGHVQEWAQIEDAVFLNGATPHPDGRTLLICESMTGRIIAVDQTKPGTWHTWLTHDDLRPTGPQVPGANGVKFFGNAATISVTARNLLLRVALNPDGSAGAVSVAAENLRADDFAFDAAGALYIATHPANSVLRLAADGSRTTLAGPATGAVGATAVAFGRSAVDSQAIYITTTGGAWSPYQGVVQRAKLVRYQVGASGQSLLA